MSRLFKSTLMALCCLLVAVPAFGQSQTFIVDDDGDPLLTYPDLATAVATAKTFTGTHTIVIMPGSYGDCNIVVTGGVGVIGEIGGDASAVPEDVVFTAPSSTDNFLTMKSDFYIHNMKIVGYAKALTGSGLSNTTIEDIIVTGASGTGIEVNTWSGGMVDGFTFSNLDYGITGTTWSGCTIQNGSFDNVGNAIDATDCDNGIFDVLAMSNGNYGLVLRAGSHPNTMTGCTITDMANDGVWLWDANVDMSGCTAENNTGYGVNKSGTGSHWLMTVEDNCFLGNNGGAVQAYDDQGATWDHNYYSDLAFPGASYTLAGGTIDGNPWRAENQPVGPLAADIFGTVDVDFEWVVPDCDQTQYLAAYEFTVTWDPTRLAYVSADYDEAFLGSTSDGALYTLIGGDPATGSLVFAATNFSLPGEGSGRLAFAQFEAIKVGPVTITVASDYRDEGNNPISVKDPLGLTMTISDNERPVMVSLTANNPIGDDTYSDYVPLTFSADATDNYCLYYMYYILDGGSAQLAGPLSGVSDGLTDIAVSLGALGEGAHTLGVFVRDCAPQYLYSDTLTYAFTIDRTGPSLTAVLLSDADGCAIDAEYTNDPTVAVDLTDDGTAVTMQIWDADSPGWQTAIAYANPTTYTLLNTTDGGKQVYYRLIDAYGNIGNQMSDLITLDQVAPVPSSFVLAGGALKTSATSIDGDVNHGGLDAAEHAVSENAAELVCGSGIWRLDRPHPITPIDLSSGDGTKTVYYASRDLAGNISIILSDDIDLDQTAPEFVSFAVEDQNGDECSDSWTVDVVIEWSDADVKEVHLGMVTGGPYPAVVSLVGETSPKTIAYAMTDPPRVCDAMNMIYGVLIDDVDYGAPNQGAEASDGIFVDCYPPTITGIELSWDGNTVWSQSATVDVTLSGFAADIIAVEMGEVTGTYTVSVPFDPGDPVVEYTFAAPATTDYLYLRGIDCAGRVSGEVVDGMKFDLIDPVISGVSINSGAVKTNTTAVSIGFTWTEVNPLTVWLSEDPGLDPGHATTVSVPWGVGPPYAFTLTSGDGVKTVYVKLVDKSGRVSTVGSDDIVLDMTLPTGSMTVRQIPATNPYATAGYTNKLTGIEAINIAADADVVDMIIQALPTPDGSNSGWVPLATTYQPISLNTTLGEGPHTVRIKFRDDAGNAGAWVNYTIIYDVTAPSAPATAFGMPGGSLDLSWSAVTDVQSYILRYNFNGDYPLYTLNNPPPHPATLGEGIAMAVVTGTSYSFAGPQPDIYSVSIWSRDLAGNVSLSPNAQVSATNYILGDFWDSDADALGPDGCIDFADEFGALASAYNSVPSDPNWNMYLNIAPTCDGAPTSRPTPDASINFEDLIIFALNYVHHRCGAGATGLHPISPKTIPSAPVALTADLPSSIAAGTDVSIPVRIANASGVRGFHVVLDYNADDVTLIGIEAGAAFGSVQQSFFYYDRKVSCIDVSGAVLDADGAFSDDVLFVVHLRSNSNRGIELSARELVCRNDLNADIMVEFGVEFAPAHAYIPTDFALAQNYPNPFNAGTVIPFDLKEMAEWSLTVYNVAGQVVKTFSGSDEGRVSVAWDGRADNGSPMASGMYFYRLSAADFVATKKMVLLK